MLRPTKSIAATIIRHAAAFALLAALGLFAADVNAVDGNYSSPYGSQYDNRSTSANLPVETLFGAMLLVVNFATAVYFSLRYKSKKAR